MPTVVIPDKICPHCGGNEWYARPCNDRKGLKYTCSVKRQEYLKSHKPDPERSRMANRRYRERHPEKSKEHTKKWRDANKDRFLSTLNKWKKANIEHVKENKNKWLKKQVSELSDFYIRTAIANQVNEFNRENNIPERVKPKTISQETIEKYREGIRVQRTLKKQNEMKNVAVKKSKAEIYKNRSEGQKRSWEKRRAKLNSAKEYESTAAIGVEEPVIEQVVTKQPEMDIVTEFKKLEERRIEIMNEVENFNNYVESLKIKLS